jgi:hypothetical protein
MALLSHARKRGTSRLLPEFSDIGKST